MCNYHATVLDTYKSENDSQLFTARVLSFNCGGNPSFLGNITSYSYFSAVVLKITGFASTCWTDDTTDSENKTTTHTYSGHEDYIRSKVELLSSNRKGKYCRMKCFI